MSFRFKWGLWYGTYLVVAILIWSQAVFYFWVFPAGLFRIFWPEHDPLNEPCILGWIPYAVLTLLAYFTTRRSSYYIIYAVFCVLVLTNVVGCRMMVHIK